MHKVEGWRKKRDCTAMYVTDIRKFRKK